VTLLLNQIFNPLAYSVFLLSRVWSNYMPPLKMTWADK